jgi:sporulation protein YlmC with PRC-barrel domain
VLARKRNKIHKKGGLNMVLYSELKDFKVYSQLGDDRGSINDLIIDLSNWDIKNLIISPGMIRKNVMYKPGDLKEVKESEKKIIISGDLNEEELPESSTFNSAFADNDLIGKEVVTKDNQDIGKVYDFDVPLKLDNWMVWKILIKRGLKERRLRVGPDEIESVSDKIILKKSISEIDGQEENQE